MNFSRSPDRIGACFRKRDVASQSTFNQPRHGAYGLLHRHLGIDPRHAKDIKAIDAKPFDALFAVLRQILRRTAAAIAAGVGTARAAGLRMNHDSLAPAFEGLGNELM